MRSSNNRFSRRVPTLALVVLLTAACNRDKQPEASGAEGTAADKADKADKLETDGKTSGSRVMINGSPTDNNAKLFKAGAHSILDGSGFTVGSEYDTPDWSPDRAQQQMEQAITRLGKPAITGVSAANAGTAGGRSPRR